MPHGTDVCCPELTQADNERECEYAADVDKFHGGRDTSSSATGILWNVGVVSNTTIPGII